MKRSEIYRWLQQHQGQKGMPEIEYVKVPNPAYNTPEVQKLPSDLRPSAEVSVKKVTWTANDGTTLSVLDRTSEGTGEKADQPAPYSEGAQPGPIAPPSDPDYEPTGTGREKRDPNEPLQTPYQQALGERDLAEANANAAAPGGRFETNAQRDARIQKEEDQKMQRDAAARADRKEGQGIAAQEAANEINRGKLTIDQQAEARQQATANQPHFLSQAGTDNPTITYFDPKTGQIQQAPNPNYDAVKIEAERKRQELTLAIQLGDLDQRQATQQYTQWFQTNVQAPLMVAQEERARAADQRAAMQAEEQRNQFAADFGLRGAQFGQKAGQDAASNELAMLPYRTGPKFAGQFSDAINGLAAGGVVGGPSPAAGIHFTADAFKFKRPDIEGIAKKATAAALKHVSSYIPTEGSFPSVGGSMPNIDLTQAPSGTGSITAANLLQQFGLGKYAGPGAAPAAAPAPPVDIPPEAQPVE